MPQTVYRVTEGVYGDAATAWPGGHADSQNLTWLLHVVRQSSENVLLALQQVDATFARGDATLWRETMNRAYLERLEWIEGAYELTTEYCAWDFVKLGADGMPYRTDGRTLRTTTPTARRRWPPAAARSCT